MKIKVHLVNDDKHYQLDLPESAKVYGTLKKLDIPPDTVIITRDGKPIPVDTVLNADDELTVIRVVSGG